MGFKGFVVVAVSLLASVVLIPGNVLERVAAQATPSTRDGVYTAAQAAQGKTIYQKQCASCHGPALLGGGKHIPLVGDAFLNKWTGQTMADLFMKTNTSMPASAPGTMTPDETSAVLAYILSMNKFQAGQKPLPTDPDGLGAIQVAKP